jgi:hypothetical protein
MGSLRRLSTVALSLGLICLGACQKPGRELRDSEGRTFSFSCKSEDDCSLKQKSGAQRVEKPAQALLLGSRLVGLCDVKEGEAPQGPYDCRPLLCKSDEECPPAHGMKDGQCLNGRCSDPAEAVGVQDSIMLCLSGTGLGRESAAQVERYALALNCGKPCKIPAPCPQL